MEKQKDYSWLLILLVLGIAVLVASCNGRKIINPITTTTSSPNTPHQCIDKTHDTCDGKCECDGFGCTGASDYQLVLLHDTIWVYDNGRLVGTIYYGQNIKLDSLIDVDNQ